MLNRVPSQKSWIRIDQQQHPPLSKLSFAVTQLSTWNWGHSDPLAMIYLNTRVPRFNFPGKDAAQMKVNTYQALIISESHRSDPEPHSGGFWAGQHGKYQVCFLLNKTISCWVRIWDLAEDSIESLFDIVVILLDYEIKDQYTETAS